MNKLPDHIDTLTPEIMVAYLNGALTAQDMHKVERLMLDSDFDAEAMEGFELTGAASLQDLEALNKQIDKRTSKPYLSWIKVAATLLLLAAGTWMVVEYSTNQVVQKEMAQEQSTPEQNGAAKQDVGDSQIDMDSEPETDTPATVTDKSDDLETGEAVENLIAESTDTEEPAMAATEEMMDDEMDQEIANLILDDAVAMEETEELSALQVEVEPEVTKPAITPERESVARASKLAAPTTGTNTVQGQVTSTEDGSPLPGVNVVVKGTTTGTVTDLDGNFLLEGVTTKDELIFSYIGLATEEVKTNGKSQIALQMSPDSQQLSEVVVTSYSSINIEEPSIRPARPEGGLSALKWYLREHLADSTDGKDKCIVAFTVNADGTLTNFEFKKLGNDSLKAEIIRLLQQGPKWHPATVNEEKKPDQVMIRLRY